MTASIPADAILRTLKSEGVPFKDDILPQLEVIAKRYHPDGRERIFPPGLTALLMAVQAIDPTGSMRSTVIRNNAQRVHEGLEPSSVNTAAFSDARQRLQMGVIKEGARNIAVDLASDSQDSWAWKGLNIYAVDGSTLTANDTPQNQAAFPQHKSQAIGAGFPILRCVVLQCLSTGAISDAAMGAYKGKGTGEMSLVEPLLSRVGHGDLLLGDRYYPCFTLIASLLSNECQGVFQSHGARHVDFRRGERIGPLDHIVTWTKPAHLSNERNYKNLPDQIRVREIDITERVGTKDRFIIVTTLLDPQKYPADDIAALYLRRWGIELALRDLKDKMGMDMIAANEPQMVEKDFWAHILGYNLVRLHMANAAAATGYSPAELSFLTALQTLLSFQAVFPVDSPPEDPTIRATIYRMMTQCRVGQRPGRTEPRAVKRRPKAKPRLTKPRADYRKSRA